MKIVHVSDLQIPRIKIGRLKLLADAIKSLEPDLLVISGDITQRTKPSAFKQGKEFIHEVGVDSLVVPGNHDLPLYSLRDRIEHPLRVYSHFFGDNVEPSYRQNNFAVQGLCTPKPWLFVRGCIYPTQVKRAKDFFSSTDNYRIIVTHHPLAVPPHFRKGQLAWGSFWARRQLGEAKIDLYLSGHYHVSSVIHREIGHGEKIYHSVFVQAGTISDRQRGEPISFNFINLHNDTLGIEQYYFNPANENYVAQRHYFHRTTKGWIR